MNCSVCGGITSPVIAAKGHGRVKLLEITVPGQKKSDCEVKCSFCQTPPSFT